MEKITILYDATIIAQGFHSGIYFVAYHILCQLCQKKEFEITLYFRPEVSPEQTRNCTSFFRTMFPDAQIRTLNDYILPKNSCIEILSRLIVKTNRNIVTKISGIPFRILRKLLTIIAEEKMKHRFNVFFSPVFSPHPDLNTFYFARRYIVLHDMMPTLFPQFFPPGVLIDSWYASLLKSFNRKDAYFAVSECTKKDFLHFMPEVLTPEQITVIPLASSHSDPAPSQPERSILSHYHIPNEKKYIFSLCSLEPRKNLLFTIQTFLNFIKKHQIKDLIFVIGGAPYDGQDPLQQKILHTIQEMIRKGDPIVYSGYIADEDIGVLYGNALCSVYNSLYEGFGLPPLEAMSFGTPVITSNTSSLPEVVGDAGIQVSPTSEAELIKAFETMYFQPKTRELYRQRGLNRSKKFSWRRTGDLVAERIRKEHHVISHSSNFSFRHIGCCFLQQCKEKMIGLLTRYKWECLSFLRQYKWGHWIIQRLKKLLQIGRSVKESFQDRSRICALAAEVWKHRTTPIEKRIAVFTPLPPEETGIARFSQQEYTCLPELYDIIYDVKSVKDYKSLLNGGSKKQWNVIAYTYYKEKLLSPNTYLSRIFVVGNSPHHDPAVREAIATNGEPNRMLYLHEALIHGAFFPQLEKKGIPLQTYVAKYYPEVPSEALNQIGQPDFEWNTFCHAQKIWGVRPLLLLSGITDIIVNNENAKELILSDLLPWQKHKVRIKVLFLPIERFEKLEKLEKSHFQLSPETRLIGSFGFPTALKGSDQVVDACMELNRRGIPVKLLLAGYNAARFVASLPKEKQVICLTPDTTSTSDFLKLMNSVDLAVQLRLQSHGESSGCICQLMGMRKNLLTNKGFINYDLEKYATIVSPQPDCEEICKKLQEALLNPKVVPDEILKKYSHESGARLLYEYAESLFQPLQKPLYKILVDGTLLDGHGIQRATDALYAELLRRHPDIEIAYVNICNRSFMSNVPQRNYFVSETKRDYEIADLIRSYKPDIVHFPFNGNFNGEIPAACRQTGTLLLTTIHDIIPAMIPHIWKYTDSYVKQYLESMKMYIEMSDVIFTDSEYTAHDIYAKIRTQKPLIVLNCAPMLKDSKQKDNTNTPMPYFLYNGGYCPRKGIDLLISNFIILKKQGKLKSRLILTGHPGVFPPKIQAELEYGKQMGWIEEKGFVTDEELYGLFAHAQALVYPTLYEGFGLPPLEAMRIGCPVITTHLSSLPEVCGDAALYLYDRENPQEFQAALIRMETDSALRERLIKAGKQQAEKFTLEKGVSFLNYLLEKRNDLVTYFHNDSRNFDFQKNEAFHFPSLCLSAIGPHQRDLYSIELLEGGIQYGPYINIPAGAYHVTYTGKNLEALEFSCSSDFGKTVFPIQNRVGDNGRQEYDVVFKPQTTIRNLEFSVRNPLKTPSKIFNLELRTIHNVQKV